MGAGAKALATTLVGLHVLTAMPASAQPEGWPTVQGGSEHLGQAPRAPAPPLKQAWRSAGPPTIAVVAVPGLAIAVGQTTVMAFDPATGHALWTLERTKGPLSAAAIDPASGPNGTVVFTEGDRKGLAAVVGLDPITRQRLWTVPLGDIAQGSPTIADGRVYVGSRDRSVYAVDARSGKTLWKTTTEANVNTTPAVSGSWVFVVSADEETGNATLRALDVSTGRVRWSYRQPRVGVGTSTVTATNGAVYAGFGDHVVRGFDAATGAVLWATAVRAAFSRLSSLAAAGGSVYALDDIGGVYRLDARTGHLIWDYQFPAFVTWSSPIVAGDQVYVGMDDGTLAAIEVPRGHLVWSAVLTGELGALAAAGDLLLVPLAEGSGGTVAFARDPSGALVDEPSPTELDLPSAMANFAGAFLVMTVLLVGLFRFVLRSPRGPAPSGEGDRAPSDDDQMDSQGRSLGDDSAGPRDDDVADPPHDPETG